MKQKNSMEGQTLAFGLGSPDNVFRNRYMYEIIFCS